jgi:hypothetical protein
MQYRRVRNQAPKTSPKDALKWLVMAAIVTCGMVGYKMSLDARAAQDTPRVQKDGQAQQGQAEEEYVMPEPQFGVVTSIVYCDDKPMVTIEEQMLHEGDSIHDVTVTKIETDKVEFEKFGNRWQQAVQEPASRQWHKSRPSST